MTRRIVVLAILMVAGLLVIAGCGAVESPAESPDPADDVERPASRFLDYRDDPQPIHLPDDAAPHDRLTEWWYYTGHLENDDGDQFGFQFVIFQVRRGDFPPTWAAHLAITEATAGRFAYDERIDSGEQPPGVFPINFEVGGWMLQGGDGEDHISAEMPGYALDLTLTSEKPPIFHEGEGYFQFAPGAESYYYSRTRMGADGTLTIDGVEMDVTGIGWFDQQWGDFLVLDDVGWDWFSVQLDNGEELMAWRSHDRRGNILDGNATLVDIDGNATDVSFEELEIESTGEWQSPESGGTYPMGWIIRIPAYDIDLVINPVMEAQELDTSESTGVIYWEGMIEAGGTYRGNPVEGLGYVELTGYAEPQLDSAPGSE